MLVGVAVAMCWPAKGVAAPGDLDPSFSGNGIAELTLGPPLDIAVDGGGEVVVLSEGDQLERFASDGSIDASFDSAGLARAFETVGAHALGELVVGLEGSLYVPGEEGFVAKLQPNGSPDASFGSGGVSKVATVGDLISIAVDDAGRVVVGGTEATTRLRPDGTADPFFAGDGIQGEAGGRVAVVPGGGNILVAELVKREDGTTDERLVRLDSGGQFDSTFGDAGAVPFDYDADFYSTSDESVSLLDATADGGALVGVTGCVFTIGPSGGYHCLTQLISVTADGTLSGRFTPEPTLVNYGAAGLAPDGSILSAGLAYPGARYPRATAIVRRVANPYAPHGSSVTDISYAYRDLHGEQVMRLASAPDGDIVAATGEVLMRFTSAEGPADADADGVVDEADRCDLFAGPATSGCPKIARTVRVGRGRTRHILRVEIEGPGQRLCEGRLGVQLRRVLPGRDRVVATARTNYRGWAQFEHLDFGDVYYVVAKKRFLRGIGTCVETSSRRRAILPPG